MNSTCTAAPQAVNTAMVSGYGKFATDADGAKPEALTTITFDGIAAMVDQPLQGVPKDHAQWLIPSLHPSRKGQETHGRFSGIWADIDAPAHTIQETRAIVAAITQGADFEIYASRSATEAKQKCRVIVPIEPALTPQQWLAASAIFREKLAAAGVATDPASVKPGQVLYLPNAGDYYDTASVRGSGRFSPLMWWCIEVAAHEAALTEQAAAVKADAEAAKQRREAMALLRSTEGFESLMDAVNAAYSMGEVLTRNAYDRRGDKYRHPGSESGSYSASGKDGRVHSLSTNDPLYTGGKGGDGAHDVFSAIEVLEYGGDRDKALKDLGVNHIFIGGEPWNRVRQREYLAKQNSATTIDADGVVHSVHPLALFEELAQEPKAPRWVIPGFIGHGVTVIAGTRGVGKTTTLLPLAMAVAGMPTAAPELAPTHWRHVVYITEDLEQAERIIAGLVRYGGRGVDWAHVRERLHIVRAQRLPPGYVAQVGAMYRERFGRTVEGVDLLPLVVIDTMAATIDLENENDNAEASKAMAALKQGFEGLPVWMVGHTAKGSLTRADVQGITLRGASAFEADANGVLYLFEDAKQRFLMRGKSRFESQIKELEIQSHWQDTIAAGEFGEMEPVRLLWATLVVPQQSREVTAMQAKETARQDAASQVRAEVRAAVETAWHRGNPLNRAGVKATVRRKTQDVTNTIENLLHEQWLIEVHVPPGERKNSRKVSYLVALSTAEHEAVGAGGLPPAAKLKVPATWRKPADQMELAIGGVDLPSPGVPDTPTPTDQRHSAEQV